MLFSWWRKCWKIQCKLFWNKHQYQTTLRTSNYCWCCPQLPKFRSWLLSFYIFCSQDVGHLWNSAVQLGISSAPRKPWENSTQQGWQCYRKGSKLPEISLISFRKMKFKNFIFKSPVDLKTYSNTFFFPFPSEPSSFLLQSVASLGNARDKTKTSS